jgi:hypothetical protein
MSAKSKIFQIILLVVVVILLIALMLPSSYAKGEKRSSEDPQNTRDDRSSDARPNSDRSGSDHDVSSRTVIPSESRETRSESVWTFSGSRSGSSGLPSSETREKNTVLESKGIYRRNYESLGQIWKERHERRDTSSDQMRSRSSTHTNIYVFPGTYSYYCYEYIPGRVYPSVYCYYLGVFPPYIHGGRVIYIHYGHRRYTYVDLPIVVILHECKSCDTSYYLEVPYFREHWQYRSLSEALKDIERAWERGDIGLLMKHVRPYSVIDVFLEGEYAYSLDWRDYQDMTRDAMSNIRTVNFSFYRLRERNDSNVIAYGKHTYRDEYYPRQISLITSGYSLGLMTGYSSSIEKTVYVSYTLERHGSDWYIKEVGVSPYMYY